MSTKRRLVIDADIRSEAVAYVQRMLHIMRQHGAAPDLSESRLEQLIYDCARYPQELRNVMKKRKRAGGETP